MKITELLSKDTIILQLKAKTKLEAIDELVNKLDDSGKLNDKEKYKKVIIEREQQFSTGVGHSIAIPHAKTSAVKTPSLAYGYSVEGIDYEALDDKPVHIFFMIAGSEGADNEHLETLSRLSIMLMNEDFMEKLKKASSEEEILNLINAQEKLDTYNEEKAAERVRENLVLAVTACPTGIAHTYMASDSLENKAREMGINIKVETNGSSGTKNKLTRKEIKKASGIIVAADKQVEMARFNGKKIIQVPVAEAIKAPEALINKAVNGEGHIYYSIKKSDEHVDRFYKHLMSGVSNMLPFVVGGGILTAISFMFEIKGYNLIANLLKDIGVGNTFELMIPVLAGFIGMSIADRPGFAPAMVGGLITAKDGGGFLGGLIAGYLGGYIVELLKRVFNKLPSFLDDLKPILLYPLFGIFITGIIMFLIIDVPVKAVNASMFHWLGSMGAANRIFLGLVLGAMMALDMGGPINKIAFTFGIAMLEGGNYLPSAAIMAAGMVPPLGIAIATSLFRSKFTFSEKDAGKKNYIMGVSFITEGAIPFAASDSGRIIPSIVVGSSIAGALSMAFNIGLPAPHGGIFVVPIVIGNPFLYVLAILIGSFITALMIGILKHKTDL